MTEYSYAGYLVPFGDEIDVIAQLSPLITPDVLALIKREPRIVAGRHRKEVSVNNVCAWYISKKDKLYEGVLKGIYICKTTKHLFIVGQMFFSGEALTVVIYNDSNKFPIELKILANKGELGKMIPLEESIKVQNCKPFIQ